MEGARRARGGSNAAHHVTDGMRVSELHRLRTKCGRSTFKRNADETRVVATRSM